MVTFSLNDLEVELKKRFAPCIQAGNVFVSTVATLHINTDERAQLWMNAKCGGTVIGVDFKFSVQELVVSIFFRSIQNVNIASKRINVCSGVWESSQWNNTFGFAVSPYGNCCSSGCKCSFQDSRMQKNYKCPKDTVSGVVDDLINFLTLLGKIG